MNKSNSHKTVSCSMPMVSYEKRSDHDSATVTSAGSAYQLPREDAAEYIEEVLISLRALAVKAELDILADLIEVAGEEARLHKRH